MGFSDQIELGEGAVILTAVVVIGYVVYKASGSLAGAASSVGTAVKNAASSAVDAAGGIGPTQTLPAQGGNVEVRGTGSTVSELMALGYTQSQIGQMIAEGGLVMRAPVGCSSCCCCRKPACCCKTVCWC